MHILTIARNAKVKALHTGQLTKFNQIITLRRLGALTLVQTIKALNTI